MASAMKTSIPVLRQLSVWVGPAELAPPPPVRPPVPPVPLPDFPLPLAEAESGAPPRVFLLLADPLVVLDPLLVTLTTAPFEHRTIKKSGLEGFGGKKVCNVIGILG